MNRTSVRPALRLLTALAAAAVVRPEARADREWNLWPIWVEQAPASAARQQPPDWSAVGPLFFGRTLPAARHESAGKRVSGLRPLYVQTVDTSGTVREAAAVYPFLTYRRHESGHQRWSFFNLVNYSTGRAPLRGEVGEAAASSTDQQAFDVWPVYFSRKTGHPDLDYWAVFPVWGTVRQRFGQDRFSWVVFPLYGRFERRGVTTTTAPWPFVKVLRGQGNRGFELWPLFGHRAKEGAYREQFLLWPFFYRQETALWQEQPHVKKGALPFYAVDRSPGYVSETWLWPFFGYVDRTEPYRYRANHYFWPFFVQGRGDDRRVNRWAPFYTHSVIKGTDKRWILWPVWKDLRWEDPGLAQRKRQLLFVLYNSTEQRSLANPSAPAAEKYHVWPLLSGWDNGAGRKQVQVLSPFEVFFPHNEIIRQKWSPLFALYRFDQPAPGHVRHSALWNAMTFERNRDQAQSEFHLGPLFSRVKSGTEKRVALLGGLLGWERRAGSSQAKPFFGQFSRKHRLNANSHP